MNIDQINELHDRAMDKAEQAVIARDRRDESHAEALFREALELESKAATMVAADVSLEPTRSVLHRSAASLALNCGEYRTAEKLIATGLAGEPPEEIANELRDLIEQVYSQRHLLAH